jgi:AcrR family transcriptional regulator
MTGPDRRRYHHGDLRRTLLAEAESVLERGDDVNLRELARAIGVSPAAPFRHFTDKRALVRELAREGFERLGTRLSDVVTDAPMAFSARLTAVGQAYVRFAVAHPALLRVMVEAKQREPDVAATALKALSVPLEIVSSAQRRGEVVPGEYVGTTVCAALDGVASQALSGQLPGGHEELHGIVAAVVQHLVQGLQPRSVDGGGSCAHLAPPASAGGRATAAAHGGA